jgi:argininosuccinate synthase
VAATKEKIYSRDRNLWHISHEGGRSRIPNWEPTEDLFLLTRAPEEAPDRRST